MMIPVVNLGGLQVPEGYSEGTEASRVIGEAFVEALHDISLPADTALEIFATWIAALITVHPSTREYLEQLFQKELAERLRVHDNAKIQ